MEHTFEVIVGNLGRVHSSVNRSAATNVYAEYVHMSQRGEGRAAGESVTLTEDGEIVLEYEGTSHE